MEDPVEEEHRGERAETGAKPRPARRWRRRLLRAAVLLAVVLAAVYVFRIPLLGGFVKRRIASELGSALGGVYSIERVEGSWISELVVVGLRTEQAPAAGSVRGLQAERIAVRYRLLGLLDDPLAALSRVETRGLRLEVDATAPSDGSPPTSPTTLFDAVPTTLPEIDIEGAVAVTLPDGEGASSAFSIVGSGDTLGIVLSALDAPLLRESGDVTELRGTVRRTAPYVLEWTSSSVVGGVAVPTASLTAEPWGWSYVAHVEVAGGRVVVEGGRDALTAVVRNVEAADLPKWTWQHSVESESFPQSARIDADATLRTQDGKSILALTVAVADLAWRDVRIDMLESAFEWGEGRGVVRRLTGRSGGASLRAADVALDANADYVVTSAGELNAEVPDARALAQRLGLTEVTAQLPEERTAMTLRCRVAEGLHIDVDELSISCAASRVDLSGGVDLAAQRSDWRTTRTDLRIGAMLDLLLGGQLPATATELPPMSGPVTVEGSLKGTLGEPQFLATARGDELTIDGRTMRDLTLNGALLWPIARISNLRFRGEVGTVDAAGSLDLERRLLEGARLTAYIPDAALLSRLVADAPALTGDVRVSTTLDGDLRPLFATATEELVIEQPLRGPFDLSGTDMSVADVPLGAVTVTGSLAWPRLTLDPAVAERGGDVIRLQGSLDLESLATQVAELHVRHARPAEFAALVPELADASGSVSVDGALDIDDLREPREARGHLRIATQNAMYGDTAIGDAQLDTQFNGRDVTVSQLHASGDWGTADSALALRVEDDAVTANVDRLSVKLRDDPSAGTIELAAPTAVRWADGELVAGPIDARVSGGHVRGDLRFAETIAADLTLDAVDLAPFFDQLGGHLSGRLRVSGDRREPVLDLDVAIPDLVAFGETGELHVRARQNQTGITVERLEIDAGSSLRASGSGSLPFRVTESGLQETAVAAAHFEGHGVSEEPARWLHLLGPKELRIARAEIRLLARGSDLDATLTIADAAWIGELPRGPGLPGETVVEVHSRSGGVQATVRNQPAAELHVEGDLRIPAMPAWWRPERLAESLRGAPVEGSVSLAVADVGVLSPWVAALVRASGRAHGEVALGGTLGAPTWSGHLHADDLALRLEGAVPSIGGGTLRLSFDERELRLERFSAQLGYAPISASGTVRLANGAQPEVALEVRGENALVARNPDLRLRADVDLSVRGPPDALSVTGDMVITDALYSRSMELIGRGAPTSDRALQLFSIRGGPLSQMTLDVHVRADETIRIENNLLRGAFSADLQLRGTGAVPVPEGRIDFRETVVLLPLSRLQVERGSLVFPPGSPFDPHLDASAFTRMKGYDLTVQVTGGLADSSVLVAANPPLSQEAALLLLTTGSTPEELQRDGIASTALSKAGSLLGGVLLTWVSGPSDPDASSVWDRVTLEFGREQSRSGASTIDAEVRLTDRWYLHGERDRYDDVNFGVLWRLRFR